MSRYQVKRQYRCWNDCQVSGCPGHIATLAYQSVSEAFTFDDGKGRTLEGQTPELTVLVDMLREIAPSRLELAELLSVPQPGDRS